MSAINSGSRVEIYASSMDIRSDIETASRVDIILTLLPMIGWLDAAWALAESNVPLEVAARVLALPDARRNLAPAVLATVP